ncbi:MAG: HAD family phosphatase [Treponema sp.]|nr:HAD family phosphatase [Treponema sp.]
MLYIFDMGGVVTTTCAIVPRLEKILGLKEGEFLKICGPEGHPGGVDLLSMCSDGLIGAKDFWRLFGERSGIAVKTDWWHYLFHPILNEGTVSIVRQLKKTGHRVVCGTNTMESHYLNHLERGDYSYFDQTYASCLMGVSKPDPKFWQIILTAENVQEKDAVFIDDKKINCDAAAQLGIHAVHFESSEQLANSLKAFI